MLQQKESTPGLRGYVNSDDNQPLYFSISVFVPPEGSPRLISPRIVRLLVDAGADTTSPLRVIGREGEIIFSDTPLALVNRAIHEKVVSRRDATEEQMNRLEAVRRLLLRAKAVHAISWLWRKPVPTAVGGRVESTSRTDAASIPLGRILPTLRQR